MTAAAGGKGKYARGTASRRRTDADDLDSAGRKRPRRRERGARARKATRTTAPPRRGASSRPRRDSTTTCGGARRARRPSSSCHSATTRARPPAPVRVAEQESGGTRWAWGRGEAEAPPSMSGAELLDVAARRAAADRAENDDDAAPRSDTAVKSVGEDPQPGREEPSGEIHAEAERERAAAPRRQAQEKARVAGLARLIGRLEKDHDGVLRPLPSPPAGSKTARRTSSARKRRRRGASRPRRRRGRRPRCPTGARRPGRFYGMRPARRSWPGARPAPRAASPSRSAPVTPATPRAA